MSQKTLTTAQKDILELLSAFEYLTTRQVCEYLALPVTKRAIEQKLQRLQRNDFVRAQRLHPELGNASELRWNLLRKGANAIEVPYDRQQDAPELLMIPGQTAILQLLTEMKQLTTTQIWQHLRPTRTKWGTWEMLDKLRKRRMVRSNKLYPERGPGSEHYWMLLKRGADAIGLTYDKQYRRRPTRTTIEHRGLLLNLSRQVERVDWSLIKPVPFSRFRPRSDETPHRRQLVEAVLKSEQIAIEDLLQRGYSPSSMRDRVERYEAGKVGAVVPRSVYEYVAYVPGQPELTIVLIPHPPIAGRGFWTRAPGARIKRGMRNTRYVGTKPTSKIDKYRRLARALPVIAVFGCEEASRQYAGLLEAAGFQLVLVDEVAERLQHFRTKVTGITIEHISSIHI